MCRDRGILSNDDGVGAHAPKHPIIMMIIIAIKKKENDAEKTRRRILYPINNDFVFKTTKTIYI